MQAKYEDQIGKWVVVTHAHGKHCGKLVSLFCGAVLADASKVLSTGDEREARKAGRFESAFALGGQVEILCREILIEPWPHEHNGAA